MSEEISWCVELRLRPGKLEQFRALTGAMVEATRAEQGVLSYQRFIADDGSCIHVYERYENAAAAAAHVHGFAEKFGADYSALVERTRFTVYGAPSNALRTLLDRYGAVYMKPFGDLDYW